MISDTPPEILLAITLISALFVEWLNGNAQRLYRGKLEIFSQTPGVPFTLKKLHLCHTFLIAGRESTKKTK